MNAAAGQGDLFAAAQAPAARESLASELVLLRGFASPTAPLLACIERVAADAPFRHLETRGGRMSVAMTNCGEWGWHSDARGYGYVSADPLSGVRWPPMPEPFRDLAREAASRAGFGTFEPDACLVNRYAPGAQLGTHRDFDELDMRFPIVSVSIGLPATFFWYGATRRGRALRVPLADGDVLVWGGQARPGFHGVRRLEAGWHPLTGALRYNLTFRRAK